MFLPFAFCHHLHMYKWLFTVNPIMSNLQRILLSSDNYSPMSAPHNLAALRWTSLAENIDADEVEERLKKGGWDPQWRFGMYKQAHYHSVSDVKYSTI